MVSKLLQSIRQGIAGLVHAAQTERNMRTHLVAAIVAVAAGIYFRIQEMEWIAVVLCIGIVIALECLNTGIERLADRTTKDPDPLIRQAKDASGAAVLVASVMATIVGGIVLLPKVWLLLEQR